MMHDFRSDLPRGHEGERIFHEMHSGLLTRTDGKRGDFILTASGEVVELKSEASYSATDPDGDLAKEFREAMSPPAPKNGWRPTPNLFVERYSSREAKSPGGPWQAQTHGAEYYVHLFLGDGAVFAYRTDEMVNFMEEHTGRYDPFPVWNQGYITEGFRVPRIHVAHLEIRDLFPARAMVD